MILGSIFWTNQYLNLLTNNNFVLAKKWDSAKELVLITGGSGGIGASVARRLAKEGTKVIVVDILPLGFDDREFHKIYTRVGPNYATAGHNIIYYKCDLSDMDQIKELATRIRKEVGHPTVLSKIPTCCIH